MYLFPDMFKGVVGDMSRLGVTESFLVKRQMLLSAAEGAEMILRVDNIIKAEPRYVATNIYCDDWYKKFHFCLIDPQNPQKNFYAHTPVHTWHTIILLLPPTFGFVAI